MGHLAPRGTWCSQDTVCASDIGAGTATLHGTVASFTITIVNIIHSVLSWSSPSLYRKIDLYIYFAPRATRRFEAPWWEGRQAAWTSRLSFWYSYTPWSLVGIRRLSDALVLARC